MNAHTKYLTFEIPCRMDFVAITDRVEEAVRSWLEALAPFDPSSERVLIEIIRE